MRHKQEREGRRFLRYITQGRRQLVPEEAQARLIVPPPLSACQQPAAPLLPFYEPPVGQRKKTRQRGICGSTCFCRERRGTSTFHRTEHLKASVVRVNQGSNVSTWKTRKRVKPGGAKASCRKEPIKTYQSSLSGPEPCICNTVEHKYFDCSV